jgi:hypothetical protein
MRLDAAPDWGEVKRLVTRSYSLTAPKRLAVVDSAPEQESRRS